ncbi:Hypothetical protein FKW44_004808, partial [Caligus rogercresseyi]
MGTLLTNQKLEKFSPLLASMQRILWKAKPVYHSDTSVDIIHQNRNVKPLLIDWRPLSFRRTALLNGIFTFHDLRSDSTFGGGRFRFPLQNL